ncbi:unnamed protein product [Clonostachys rosea]|uniref:NACHT domain-containing protein n=1 Tax=Bionectria ochroleuca TaxID=29856 RepID=A0ABY6V2C5_BIOOC|nr:unnamed protein product [Clonostachys rosea]
MDSLVALGLGTNVVQFVHFLSSTTSTCIEISQSTGGATKQTLEIESVYNSLQDFQTKLRSTGTTPESRSFRELIPNHCDINANPETQPLVKSLESLAADCDALCDELLDTVRKMKVNSDKWRGCKSFMVALKSAWGEAKFQRLEKRIDRFQKAISLNFFPLLRDQQTYMLQVLKSLQEQSLRLQIDQSNRFDEISSLIQDVKHTIPTARVENVEYRLDDATHQFADAADAIRTIKVSDGDLTVLDRGDIHSIIDGVSKLSVTESNLRMLAREQAFLRSLYFPCRPIRHENIPIAHRQTFEWILNEPEGEENQVTEEASRLRSWLANGDGVFWVSGKAGSGKSTAMKFIADHQATRKYLEGWAKPKKLAIASHYFWTTGTTMQKSQKGLLQSLLYDVFRASPECIPDLCPLRWSKIGQKSPEQLLEWSEPDLLQTLGDLSWRTGMPAKYCLFIDGIDEFDGDHFEICEFLKTLSSAPNLKICISSRPWNIFEHSFGGSENKKFYMHELTRRDIWCYTQDRLSEYWKGGDKNLSHSQQEDVLGHIVDKAQGVFLWVFLVTRSLRDGLVNGDTISDLRKRLSSFPTALEPFFKHMLNIVDPLYHQRMARILQVAVNARQSLTLPFYEIREYEEDDDEYALYKDFDNLHNTKEILRQCRRRINARCGGLLEVRNERVEFLHRTVRDFLQTRDMSEYLSQKGGQGFKVNLSTLKIFIYLFRGWMQSEEVLGLADDELFWRQGLAYVSDAIDEAPEDTLAHLDAVEQIYGLKGGLNESLFFNVAPDHTFRAEIVQAGAYKFVDLKLKTQPDYFDNIFESPLETVLKANQWTKDHMDIVSRFLESGIDPNTDDCQSPWAYFVSRVCRPHSNNFQIAMENDIFSQFLKHGARRDIRILNTFVDAMDDYQSGLSVAEEPKYLMPLSLLVKMIFYHENSHRLWNSCLTTLDSFFSQMSKNDGLQFTELLNTLSSYLETQTSKSIRSERLHILSRVTEKIVRKGMDIGLELQSLIPQLLGMFSGARGAMLADLIRNPGASVACRSPVGDRKRKMDSSPGSSPWKKQR